MYTIGPIALLAWVLVLSTRSLMTLYIVRFLQGINLGTVFALAPMYIAEVAEPRIRGRLSGHFQTMWAFGLLYTYVFGPYLPYQSYIYVCSVIPIIFTIFFPLMPETPYFLLINGHEEKAKKVLIWLRGTSQVENELSSMKESVAKEAKMAKGTFKDLFATKKDTKVFFIVQLICFVKYMTGSPAINSYSASMFVQASGGAVDEHIMTIILGVLLIISAFFGAYMSDTIGRRPLLIGSTIANTILHLTSGVYFYFANNTDVDVSHYTWVMYASVAGSCVVTNLGLGALLQTLQAELFPSHTRAIGSGVTGVTASIATFLDLKQYQTIVDIAGVYMNFVIFSAFGLLGAIVMYFAIPETKGKSLGEIQATMESKKDSSEENGKVAKLDS